MDVLDRISEEYCPECGEWVLFTHYNTLTGWCNECSATPQEQTCCTTCGGVLEQGRSTCRACRRENWLERYIDDIEYLVVTRGYSVAYARQEVARIAQPICHGCGRPIKGGSYKSLFCKVDKRCHRLYNRYRKLVRAGKDRNAALREVTQDI